MTQYEQNLLTDALHVAHLTQLPKEVKKEKEIWIEAIAKVRKADSSICYGILKRNFDLTSRVSYINGSISAIAEIEEIYPYITLDKNFIKKFGKNDTEKERIAYLQSLNLPYVFAGYFDGKSIEDLNKEVVKAAVYQQIKALEE